jgi:hypothetical protein
MAPLKTSVYLDAEQYERIKEIARAEKRSAAESARSRPAARDPKTSARRTRGSASSASRSLFKSAGLTPWNHSARPFG